MNSKLQDILFGHIKTPAQFGQLLRLQRKKKKFSIKSITSVHLIGNRFISELENGKPTARLNKSLEYCILIIGLDCYLGYKNIPYNIKLKSIQNTHDIGDILKQHRLSQSLTINDMHGMSVLPMRLFSDLENGRDCNLANFFEILTDYSLEFVVLPRNMYVGDLYGT